MAFRQLEWLLRERLRVGLQRFRDEPELVDALFADLSENSRANVKAWLLSHDVSILLGFPRHVDDLPCWVIAMTGEMHQRTPIGSQFSHEVDEFGAPSDERGDMVLKNYAVYTMSQNADLTVLLATMLQHVLKSMRHSLDMDGFYQMTVAQQDALDLRVEFLPTYLYARTTSISVLVEDTYLHVDSELPTDIEFTLAIEMDIPPGP